MPERENGDGAAGFACADTVLLRAAVRPPGAVAGSPDPGDAARLRQAAADDLFREAVALASPSLARVLDKTATGQAAYRLAADAGPPGHRAAPAALRQEARRLVDPDGRCIELARRPGGAQVLRARERRGPAVAAYGARLRGLGEAAWAEGGAVLTSLSHMHHNRLVGTARGAEEESLALARLAVRAHIDREQARA
ncbi:lantibiotic dehydratase C-terminal domain-containing protein [Streptomyces syringium]|uniref:lantibiotic dehydratase C-terminal domain-containing protein n=1 Tax=Streptomyces syringium TaxID=76729 RepID=UPI003454DA85